MFSGNPKASSFFESYFLILFLKVFRITLMPLAEFSCIFLENAVRSILNCLVLSTLLMIRSSFEIGSLATKLTNERFSIFAHNVLWLISIFWYMELVKNIFFYKTADIPFIFSEEMTFIHFLRDFHFLKFMKKSYLQISLKALTSSNHYSTVINSIGLEFTNLLTPLQLKV